MEMVNSPRLAADWEMLQTHTWKPAKENGTANATVRRVTPVTLNALESVMRRHVNSKKVCNFRKNVVALAAPVQVIKTNKQ